MPIRLRRVYEAVAPDDGERVLVDRLWPRGIAKGDPRAGRWLRDAAPSDRLRRLVHGDPGQWDAFVAAYAAELDAQPAAVADLLAAARAGTVTLVFAARDTGRNNAVALAAYLAARLA